MMNYINGKFIGKYDSSKNISIWSILKWKLTRKRKKYDITPLDVINESEKLTKSGDFVCWLSHASFLIQLGGKRIIIDPVLGDIPFYKRQINFPYTAIELGSIDYLLISHSHYDHFDKASLKLLSPHIKKAVIPLNMSKLFKNIIPSLDSYELDLYSTLKENGMSITLVPAKHWSRRGIFDKNHILWGGYIIEYKDKTIYFAGDTAVGSHFKEIGDRYDIDIALLPIGAYRPEFIMKSNHLNPKEAYESFMDLKAKMMIPMHYGTFMLSDEPLDEPLQWMKNITQDDERFVFLKSGECLML